MARLLLFWYEASLGCYVSSVKTWIRLNRSKSHFSRSERSEKGQIWYFAIFWQFSQKQSYNFLYIHTASCELY